MTSAVLAVLDIMSSVHSTCPGQNMTWQVIRFKLHISPLLPTFDRFVPLRWGVVTPPKDPTPRPMTPMQVGFSVRTTCPIELHDLNLTLTPGACYNKHRLRGLTVECSCYKYRPGGLQPLARPAKSEQRLHGG